MTKTELDFANILCLNHPVVYRNWAQLIEKKSHFEEDGKKWRKKKNQRKIVYSWLGYVDNDETTHKKTGP